jgi:2-aminoadipate transaminase
MSTLWESRYSLRARESKSSTIRELLKICERPGMISFAGGLPAAEVFPVQRFQEACQKVLASQAGSALQYGATEGYEPLREMIARHMARYAIHAEVENVLITSGSQQALDLIGKLLINSGDRVLVEAPTYLGALQAFNGYGANISRFPSMTTDSAPNCWRPRSAWAQNSCTSCPTFRTRQASLCLWSAVIN